jgi:hypothetical protein
MIKEDLLEMHIVISCYMILALERIGLKCLAGIESMDCYIDFGTGDPRKPPFPLHVPRCSFKSFT